ncbi:MAG: type I-E CRISPR-associated protein Cse1/CasA [Armatimonadetes bacterium]|nr:type I-E CRISPR-associated protein Cse1/CasA [Armatimonadota bacterium]
MNVFEHQSFLLRRPPDAKHPLGERVRRTYREIMTGPDEELQFDYPLEYLNVAALGLCAALTQTAFEPADAEALQERLATPIAADEFEQAIAPFREPFSIDGPIRFMQGRALESDPKKEAALLQDKVSLTVSAFMNRPDNNWVVAPDQIPLLLFSRATFFEKTAGRGYKGGTSGDLEVRTFLTHSLSVRKTIWLNVLACDQQQGRYEGDFTEAGSGEGYDQWMWIAPPTEDVPQGEVSLRAGLFWLAATNVIWIQELEQPRTCIVTGEVVTGHAGVRVVTKPTGIAYGVRVSRAKGPDVRLSFFRHPNGPYAVRKNKEGEIFHQHLAVDEVSGLLGNMGGLFFSGGGGKEDGYHIAPALSQYGKLPGFIKKQLPITLHCFGFHMLSSHKNIHGGCESERFRYPVIEDPSGTLMSDLQGLMSGAATEAEEIRKLLTRAVQICTMVQVGVSEKDGRFQFKQTANLQNGSDYKGFVRDIGREYWGVLSASVGELLARVEVAPNQMEEAEPAIKQWWAKEAATIAKGIFDRYFDDYSQSADHLAAAHMARNIFYAGLRQQGIQFYEQEQPEQTPQQPVEEPA